MLKTIGKLLVNLVFPRSEDGSFKWGARHTTIAAIAQVMAVFSYAETVFYTRKEAEPVLAQVKDLAKDQRDLHVFAAKELQRVNDHWDEIRDRLDEINRRLEAREKREKLSLLSKERDTITN